jgi:aminobenzoyl-glutamate utilization protein B
MKKQDVLAWLDAQQPEFTRMSDQIWEYAESPHKEFKSSRLQADFLEASGFHITWELGNLRTAFMAEWGSGSPVIGFAGEFDALDGLSQTRQPFKEVLKPGAPGHGCGHNLLGTGCLAAAAAVKEWLQASGTPGTVRYYGCPAEENTYGKTFMARAGVFNDLDAAFNYHPSYYNSPSKATAVGVYDIRYRFHGRAAHAGGSPHLGRSALDAVELMNVGVNYLREHVTSNVRIHYAITHGGDLPNIVPPEAEVWYFIRALEPDEHQEVAARVRKIAQGAAMMTETTMEEIFRSACSRVINNHTLADLQYENMKLIGPILFSEEEVAFARQINQAYPQENRQEMFKQLKLSPEWKEKLEMYRSNDLIGDNFPSLDEDNVETGSTDVGDLSQITPLCMLGTACFPIMAAGHSWGIVAASGSSIGHKGMMHAAKTMALSAMDCYSDPQHLQKARAEFVKATRGKPYQSPLPEHVQPPRYEPERN